MSNFNVRGKIQQGDKDIQDFVIDSGYNETSKQGYRYWLSGYKEFFGQVDGNGETNITYLQPFNTEHNYVFTTNKITIGERYGGGVKDGTQTKTGCTIYCVVSGNYHGKYWYACGY